MLTLFMSITGGLSWVEALEPLRDASEIAAACMLLYIFITIFAILNVVTGVLSSAFVSQCSALQIYINEQMMQKWNQVFCNNAIESAKADKDSRRLSVHVYWQEHRNSRRQEIAIMKQMQWHQSQLRTLKGQLF